MQRFRVWWNSFKTVAVLLSFALNLILIVVTLLLLMQIFTIKNGVLEPLIDGLHASFVGLDDAVIERTIPVNDSIPVVFTLPVDTTTDVVLTEDVPILANASFTLPGGGGVINGRVDIVLPADLVLPVQLSMDVPVNADVPVNLDVAVNIPLNETELHEPFVNLRDLLEPYVRVLDHLPDGWSDTPDFVIDVIQGNGVNLVAPTYDSEHPWPPVQSRSMDTGDAAAAPLEIDLSSSNEPIPVQVVGPTATFTPYPAVTPAP
jgi:hypothetical protein